MVLAASKCFLKPIKHYLFPVPSFYRSEKDLLGHSNGLYEQFDITGSPSIFAFSKKPLHRKKTTRAKIKLMFQIPGYFTGTTPTLK